MHHEIQDNGKLSSPERAYPAIDASQSPKHIPTVSVIVPVYNSFPYLPDCIGSLLAQTFDDFEVLLIDDASTDDSPAVLKVTTADDNRFRMLSLPKNSGLSAVRNVGLDHARGDYVLFLDSDDYFLPETLEMLVERATRQELDILTFSARSFYEDRKAFARLREDYAIDMVFDDVATGRDYLTYSIERHQYWPNVVLRMFSRELIERNHLRFVEGMIHEDTLFTVQAFIAAQRCSLLNREFYRRRVHMNSIMTSDSIATDSAWGYYFCTHEVESWLDAHANELGNDFIACITELMAEYKRLAACAWFDVANDSARKLLLARLSPSEKLGFYGQVIQPGAILRNERDAFLNSKTYRVGNILLAGPRRLRNSIAKARSFRDVD
jgi:glycosyltransferase involved in cell wall biosynthesis